MRYIDDKFKSINHKIIGEVYSNTKGLKFRVIEAYRYKSDYRFKIEFIDTGYVTITKKTEINKGLIKDRLTPTVSGIGIMGYATIKNKTNLKEYGIWSNMISRCYNENDDNYPRYGGEGISVSERWLRFDYFLEDFKLIDGYDENLIKKGLLYLDKDKKQLELPKFQRIYSLDTCCFITKEENDSYRELKANNAIKIKATFEDEVFTFDSTLDFCKYTGIHTATASWMLNNNKVSKGWYIERI